MNELLLRPLRRLHFRGKYRLLDALVARKGEREASIFGYGMRLDLSELIQRRIYLGSFESRESALVSRWLKPGMSVVDIGANVGYYTALAASLVGPQGRVFAVEPSPYAFNRLRQMIDRNRITQAQAFQLGISDAPGELPLYLGERSNHTPTMVAHAGLAPIATAPVKTLDTCLSEWGLEVVDLLKIDVEGWEPRIFAGARDALDSRRIKAILCEFNDYWLRGAGSSADSLWQLLQEAGFRRHPADAGTPGSLLETCFLVLAEQS